MPSDRCLCGSDLVFQWLIGWKKGPGAHLHDPNRRRCDDCGRTWFVPCPECGEVQGSEGRDVWRTVKREMVKHAL
jgi:hypothetical protein